MTDLQRIYVLAKPGLVIPRLGHGRKRIPAGKPSEDAHKAVRVTNNRTYRRMLREGDLVEISANKVEKAKAAFRKKRAEARKAKAAEEQPKK